MSVDSSDFCQAMREYVQAAIRLLADVCPEGPSRILVGLDEWKRDSDNVFRLRDREEPFWEQCIRAHLDQLHSLGEYHHLVATVRAIPHIAQQLENLVGTGLGSSRFEIDHVTDHLVWRLPRITEGLRFDEAQFTQLFNTFEVDLQRASFPFVLLAPLLGLKIESAPIRLTSDIEIDQMTDDEIIRCLSMGWLQAGYGMQRIADIKEAAAVRVRYHLEKRVGPTDRPQIDEALKVKQIANERAMGVLHAIRVFKEGRVSIPGLLQFSPHWPLESRTRFQYLNPGLMPQFNKYDLARNEVDEFSAFWKRFQDATAKGALANAIRRFSYANERDREDDRLVDLMIAAESLFLADAGAPQERGELRYRLALRAAFFIDSPEYSRRAIFKHMRRAYDARSAIVHGGGEPGTELLKSPTDAPLRLQDFVKVTERLVRIALKKRIDMAETTGSPLIDWENLIISS